MTSLLASRSEKKRLVFVVLFLIVMGLTLSCSLGGSGATAVPPATATVQPSDTSLPTNTVEPTVAEEPTARKKPTVDKGATREAEAEETALAATEFAGAILGEVESKLDEVGEIMGDGTVIWFYPSPIKIESSKPNIIYSSYIDSSIQAADFALYSNVRWETKGNAGIVNCVVMFRTGEDMDMDPWYSLRLSRLSGASSARFDLWQNWSIIGAGNWSSSGYFRDGNGDENELIVVAKKNQFTAYINGKQVSVWWNSRVESGGFGFGTFQDYGTTTCTYSNNWILTWD
jgi:hypothetical protein